MPTRDASPSTRIRLLPRPVRFLAVAALTVGVLGIAAPASAAPAPLHEMGLKSAPAKVLPHGMGLKPAPAKVLPHGMGLKRA